MKFILKKYRTRTTCIVIGLVFFTHYIYLLCNNSVIIKYDLVKYHLLRTGIEKKLSHFLKTSKNLEQSIQTLSDELKNPMSSNVMDIEFDQGMYKNRVKNDIILFAIPALLSSERGNPEWENSIYIYIYCSVVFC